MFRRMDIKKIPIKKLKENEYNVNEMEEKKFNKLKERMKTEGFTDPVKVVKTKNKCYVIIDGEKRKKAAEQLGIKEIPCIVFEKNSNECKILNINSNTLRGEPNPLKLAKIFEDMQEKEIIEKTLYDKSEIHDLLKLLELPDDIEKQIEELVEEEKKELPVIINFLVMPEQAEFILNVVKSTKEKNEGYALFKICKTYKKRGRKNNGRTSRSRKC